MKAALSFAFISLGLGFAAMGPGCGDAGPKGAEDDPLGEGELDAKADSLRSPTNNGVIAFGDARPATLSGSRGFHAWTFTLYGAADVQLYTAADRDGAVDTVLYLYKKTGATWGSYIARNDDDGDSVFSMVEKNLPAGEYRAIVKGYAKSTRGRFKLTSDCTGAGCAPAPAATCLFGEHRHCGKPPRKKSMTWL